MFVSKYALKKGFLYEFKHGHEKGSSQLAFRKKNRITPDRLSLPCFQGEKSRKESTT